ncbi:hypothetical protein GCM10017559_58380 [Streptosporangium longisporum]|uniref:Uncharacterized protein n=1 Tax=Streptosporangium longisporum TaxID=46187 RepID=A0ABN3YBW8_9ACTN
MRGGCDPAEENSREGRTAARGAAPSTVVPGPWSDEAPARVAAGTGPLTGPLFEDPPASAGGTVLTATFG